MRRLSIHYSRGDMYLNRAKHRFGVRPTSALNGSIPRMPHSTVPTLCLPRQETDYPVHEQIDLYDDVISPSANNGDAPEDRDYLDALPAPGGAEGGKSAPPNVVYTYTGKRIALYIGNLTWVLIKCCIMPVHGSQLHNCHLLWTDCLRACLKSSS